MTTSVPPSLIAIKDQWGYMVQRVYSPGALATPRSISRALPSCPDSYLTVSQALCLSGTACLSHLQLVGIGKRTQPASWSIVGAQLRPHYQRRNPTRSIAFGNKALPHGKGNAPMTAPSTSCLSFPCCWVWLWRRPATRICAVERQSITTRMKQATRHACCR